MRKTSKSEPRTARGKPDTKAAGNAAVARVLDEAFARGDERRQCMDTLLTRSASTWNAATYECASPEVQAELYRKSLAFREAAQILAAGK